MWRSIPIGSATGCGSAAFAILLLATPATPQAITGRAVDANTGTPVEGVAIALLDSLGTTRGSVLSDSAGEFSIAVPAPGAYALWVNRIGYQTVQTRPIDIWGAETVEVEILLDVRAVELDPLTVVGRRRENLRQRDLREYRERVEYYGEPHLGSIKLFTREYLEGWGAFTVEDMLRFYPTLFRRSGRNCLPRVYIDGRLRTGRWVDILEELMELRIYEIEGIEFYSGFGPTNSRFVDPNGCGVALVWTRPFVTAEQEVYLAVVTGSLGAEDHRVGTARYFRGSYAKERFAVDRALRPEVFPLGRRLRSLSPQAGGRGVTVDSTWAYRPPAWDEPDLLVTAPVTPSSERAVGTLFWTGDWELEHVGGDEVALDSVTQAVIDFETRLLWEDAVAQLPEGERDVEMRIERDEVRAFEPDLIVVCRYPVIGDNDRRGSFFLVYSPLAGYVLHGTFGHPEWHPDAMLTAIKPYLYFRIEGDAHLYALAARAAAWKYSDWIIMDVQTGAAVLEAY
jgi:hypothetical protein